MIRRCAGKVAVAALAALLASAGAHGADALQRDRLLEYIDSTGRVATVKTAEDWAKRRAPIVAAMQEVMGPLPGPEKRCPLDPQLVEETDCGSYVRHLLTYQSEPGNHVPAYLLLPKSARTTPAPAVLCLHPTDAKLGHKVVVGLGGKPNRDYARELAERGFVTLAPAYPHLADYTPDLAGLGYASGTMKAIWDNIRGLDLLETLPEVKRGVGFGAIGHSLGGHNAIYTSVFDPRIVAIASSCGFDSYRDYYGGNPAVWQPGKGWCQDRYMPRLARYAGRLAEIPFDFPELLAALAPRRVYVNAPLHDANFRTDSVDRVTTAAREVFRLLGAPDALQVDHPDGDHDFRNAQREAAYATLTAALR